MKCIEAILLANGQFSSSAFMGACTIQMILLQPPNADQAPDCSNQHRRTYLLALKWLCEAHQVIVLT